MGKTKINNKGVTVEATLKVEKIEQSTSGVKFVHLDLKFPSKKDDLIIVDVTFKLQCTGLAIVVNSKHNIKVLGWFLDKLKEKTIDMIEEGSKERPLELRIHRFVRDVIKADDTINKIKEIQ